MIRRTPLRIVAPLLLVAVACDSGEPAEGPAATDDLPSTAGAFVPREDVRVTPRPTGAGDLPRAIVGRAADLQGQSFNYISGDDATTGYLAVPEGAGPFPALVIIHEWNGLTDRVRQVADDFAAEGYVTLAADLFRGRVGSGAEENRALMAEAEGTVVDNLNAAVRYLRGRDDVTGRVGAMGWCYGGGVALSFGLDGENHDATAIFYGRLVEDPEVLASMDHEVYGTFAREDRGPAPESVERFEAALEAAGIENDLHIYDDVDHGFWLRVDGDPEVRGAPALDAWQRLKAYLDRTLR